MAKINYKAVLDKAWGQHLAPKLPEAPTVVSLFAGCGGSSLGYSMAGFRELLAVEWDDHAAAMFKANFPEVPLYHGDVGKLSNEQCLKIVGLQPGELDVLDGSPPCQGFSTAGRRQMTDNRNQLFREYVRLLALLRPRVFVMENVSGMVKGKMRLIFAEILRELKANGYRVSARLLNAQYFEVPQARQRLIFVGVRDDLDASPSHPAPLSNSIGIAIATIDASGGGEMLPFDDKYARLWSKIRPGQNASHVIGKGFNSCVKPHPDYPSCTLTKIQTGRGFATIAHWSEPRALSIGEAKRIGSFPDQFILSGKYSEQWARIGNSVPPLLMRAIANHLRTNILSKVTDGR